jgi:hypothetical protein
MTLTGVVTALNVERGMHLLRSLLAGEQRDEVDDATPADAVADGGVADVNASE